MRRNAVHTLQQRRVYPETHMRVHCIYSPGGDLSPRHRLGLGFCRHPRLRRRLTPRRRPRRPARFCDSLGLRVRRRRRSSRRPGCCAFRERGRRLGARARRLRRGRGALLRLEGFRRLRLGLASKAAESCGEPGPTQRPHRSLRAPSRSLRARRASLQPAAGPSRGAGTPGHRGKHWHHDDVCHRAGAASTVSTACSTACSTSARVSASALARAFSSS